MSREGGGEEEGGERKVGLEIEGLVLVGVVGLICTASSANLPRILLGFVLQLFSSDKQLSSTFNSKVFLFK